LGTAVLSGHDILTEFPLVRRLMGYCPQFDALHELLTAEEHLRFYGRIRGVPEAKLDQMVFFCLCVGFFVCFVFVQSVSSFLSDLVHTSLFVFFRLKN
jgi:hypothetical protein